MTTSLAPDSPVRSARAAFLSALPGIVFLGFYLWVGVAVLDGIVYGLTGSIYGAIFGAVVLAIPGLIATRSIVILGIEAERQIG